ncbi:MAG: AAA family ATPase, partial [Deltaproteobacteria bacterium]|nr:AAA family ATPase [Deltaproteobacteria bacterium]
LSLVFPPFRLDLANECLWCGEERISLRGKTFAVLRCLLEHPGQLVTKEALLNAVWPDTYVGESALTICIRELRQALGDNPKTPQFIETVHRRGYRFIAPLTTTQPVVSSQYPVVSRKQSENSPPQLATDNWQLTTPLVGRDAELAQLHTWLSKALQGERQIIFVTGEPGIGKTTLVEAFLERAAAMGGLWIGRGQCIEHYGAGEPYMPVLEALGRLCREPEGNQLIELLSQHAPTWLAQMPALLSATDLEVLQRKVQGATRERMLREMAEAVEMLTTKRPLVLRLEDLQWSDVSTLELLSVLARRQEWARLLVIGTYRPMEVLGHTHPLRAITQELQLHHCCQTLQLRGLTEAVMSEYLAGRFAGGASLPLPKLARLIHQRTEGNPLFMVNVTSDLIERGVLVEVSGRWELTAAVDDVAVGVPESIQQLIEQQIERLRPEEQRMLEVASVVGAEFSAAAVAAGVEAAVGEAEARCGRLARRNHLLRTSGIEAWPDGTVAARYGFLHALYQDVLYERVPAGQRIELHRRIGEREAEGYGERAGEIAAELAVHFERGRDYRRAVQYREQAGENAIQRSAHVEAISHLTKGLELLKTLPDTPERTQQELRLQSALGAPLIATKGYAAPEVGQAYTRARELCRQVGETPQLFPVLYGLWVFRLVRAELQTACELGEQLLSLATSQQDPALFVEAHQAMGLSLLCLGELAPARRHLEQGIALYDPTQHRSHAFFYGQDPGVVCLSFAAWAVWVLGYPDQALERSREALSLALELSHPFSLAFALYFATLLSHYRREWQAAQVQAEALIKLSTDQGFALYLARGTILRGGALAEQGQVDEGIAQMHKGLEALQATWAELRRPYYLAKLAAAYARVQQAKEGFTLLTKALEVVHKSAERIHEAELYRLKGELTLQTKIHGRWSKVQQEAEECFHKAIDVARRQSAKSLELRATTSLARLWQRQGKKAEAHYMLSEVYNWFTEGFDTADLQDAKTLLDELS